MDTSELLLGLGLIIVSVLNSIAIAYAVRRQKPQEKAKESSKEESNGDEPQAEEEEQKTVPSSEKRPRSKAEILAWRQSIIESLEHERGTKVITMIHKKELWTRPGEAEEIGIEDTTKVLLEFRKTPIDKPVDLILHTPGGFAVAAQMMAMAIKFHRGKVTVMVPFYAFSGGSMMSLAADEIRMEKYSVLGPVDPQVPTPDGMYPAGSLAALVKMKPIQNITDRMVILADAGNLEIENAKSFVMWLLDGKMPKDQAERVADFLSRGVMTHGTPITLDVARMLGLNVVEGVPEKVYELFKTFAFTGQSYKGS